MSVQRRSTGRGETRYDVRLRDPAGHVYTRSFRTRREAEAFEVQERADRSRGVWFDLRRAEQPFARVARAWLTSNPAKRPGTTARDSVVVERHLVPEIGHFPIGSITPADVQRLVTKWTASHAISSVRRHYAILRAILNHAVETDVIARSPCRGIKLPSLEHVDRPLPDAEALVRLAEAIGPNYAPMVYVGGVLGLRWGECAGLRVGRLDFLRATLTVAEQLTRGAGGRTVTASPKTRAGRRTLTVNAPLMELLAEHLARRGLTAADADADADARVFTSPDGSDLEYTNFRERVWLPVCAKAGLAGLGFHDLRRVAATALVAEGVDVKTDRVPR